MNAEARLPAISPEMAFVGRHWEDIMAVREGNVSDVPPEVKKLTEEVYSVADAQFDALVDELAPHLEHSLEGLIKFSKWRYSSGDWERWSHFRVAGRTAKTTHFAGLYVAVGNVEKFRLFGYLGLRPGGEDVHRELARACGSTFDDVHLPSDRKSRYPGWSDEHVIWYDQPLGPRTTRQQIESNLHDRARVFFRFCKKLI